MTHDGRTHQTSHRPAHISKHFVTLATVTGLGFMTLDIFFTIKQGFKVFKTGDFLVNCFAAFLFAGFCALVQKAAFSIFVDPKRKSTFDRMWLSGIVGQVAVCTLGAIAITAIHFSFTSSSGGLGITPKVLGISLPGQEYIASVGLVQFLISVLVGVTVAFVDEICFLCGELIKDD